MNKINFQNLPSTATPLNATNMNQLQTNIENEFTLVEAEVENLTPVVLYESQNGTNGTVTLNESAADFSYIEIFAHRATRYFSQKIYKPDGKLISMTHTYFNDGSVYLYSQANTINGTSITRGTEAFIVLTNGSTPGGGSGGTDTYIDKVLGYK